MWSPAYDLNPSDFRTQSLLISCDSNESSLDILLSAAGDYMLSPDIARKIINEVTTAMSHADQVARQCGISGRELTRFGGIFH